ncbi:MAG TPA: condensation domain-containing protein, partial [Ktedonobacteraceae bacterium]|nr:condensation domain-containing protein [Ktedonobacteraceae bacterium]
MVAEADNIEDIYELSPMQRGMLFHTLYDPHSGVYVEQAIESIEGFLDAGAFYEAWQRVIARHATLRTAFLWEELDDPMQVVYEAVEAPWKRYDWREMAPATQLVELEEMLAADRVVGFDLATPPLLRLTLLRVADDTFFLVLTYHHLLLDGWSLNIVLQEVFGAYEMLRGGQEPRFKSRRPYRDYIAWLQRQNLAEAEHFWRRYLQGFTTPTPLLLDRLGGSGQDFTISRGKAMREHVAQANEAGLDLALAGQLLGGRPVELQGFTLSLETTEALRAFARQHALTLNTVVQGAWALLLSRCNEGTDHSPGTPVDIVFGATVAGRPINLSGSEAMVGLFINTLPVRAQVDPQAELVTWLMELQIQQAEARQYEYSPLVQVHGWSEIPRGQPLFESLVVFENYHVEQQSDDGEEPAEMRVRFLQSLEQTNYPLVLIVSPEAELDVQFGFETARFTPQAMRRALGFLRTLLEGFLAHPRARL